MAALTIEILIKSVASLISGYLLSGILPEMPGDDRFQNAGVLALYIYFILVLYTPSAYKLFHALSIPILTQFLHIFQKYTFTAGANSIWRLLPFIILDLYFINFFLHHPVPFGRNQKAFVCFWILFQSFYLIISPNLGAIIGGGIVIYLLTIPLFFTYLTFVAQAIDFRNELEKYLFLLFIILGIGTLCLIHFGAAYKGSDNFLVTRNIADTNVTMAYFILLWPFTLRYANRQKWAPALTFSVTALFLFIVVFSFSRGAALLIIPYLAVTLFLQSGSLKWLVPAGLLIILNSGFLYHQFSELDLSYFWSLRFGDIFSSNDTWDKIQTTSGRKQIQQIAYDLFLKMPVTGHGTGSFEILGPGFREAHSLYYTLLAEHGVIGAIYFYSVFIYLLSCLISLPGNKLTALALLFYLIFNHTVGSVFVIIPARSISVNCVAPILLMCLYFYHFNFQPEERLTD